MAMELITDDGGVLKQVLKEGEGPLVTEGSVVIFHYNAYVGENNPEPFDSTWLRNEPYRASIDMVLVRGLALVLTGMRKGEQCRVLLSPEYAFGPMGCPPRIPPNATLLYDVTLLNFVHLEGDMHELQGFRRSEFCKVPFEVLMEMCSRAHRNGNRLFEIDDHRAAASCYGNAIRALTWAPPLSRQSQDERELWKQLLVKLYANKALCMLQVQDWQRAVNYARRALNLDPTCAKALYRCGVGLRMLGKLQEAADMLRRAARIEPTSAAITREMIALDKELAKEQENEVALCKRRYYWPKETWRPGTGLSLRGIKSRLLGWISEQDWRDAGPSYETRWVQSYSQVWSARSLTGESPGAQQQQHHERGDDQNWHGYCGDGKDLAQPSRDTNHGSSQVEDVDVGMDLTEDSLADVSSSPAKLARLLEETMSSIAIPEDQMPIGDGPWERRQEP